MLQHSSSFKKEVGGARPLLLLESLWRPRKGTRLYHAFTALWWVSLGVALVLPTWLAQVTNLAQGLSNLRHATDTALDFADAHPIPIPEADTHPRAYNATDRALARWHADFTDLVHSYIIDETAAAETNGEALEINYLVQKRIQAPGGQGDARGRETRARAVAAYFLVAVAVWLVDWVPLAVVLLQLNLLEVILAARIKTLSDSVASATSQILAAQLDFAMLPLDTCPIRLAQQQLCLQKMEILSGAWQQLRLGQTMRVPFTHAYVTLHISLVCTIVAGSSLRAVETLVNGARPDLPRLSLLRGLLTLATGGGGREGTPRAEGGSRMPQLLKNMSFMRRSGPGPAPGDENKVLAAVHEFLWRARPSATTAGLKRVADVDEPGAAHAAHAEHAEPEEQSEGPGVGAAATAAEPTAGQAGGPAIAEETAAAAAAAAVSPAAGGQDGPPRSRSAFLDDALRATGRHADQRKVGLEKEPG